MSMPRPQYQSYGKRGSHHAPPPPSHRGNHIPSHAPLHRMSSGPTPTPTETPPPSTVVEEPVSSYSNHEQVVRYVKDAWFKVRRDYTEPPEDSNRHVAYYTEAEPNHHLKDFVPFDLEELSKRRKQIASSQASS